MSTTEQVPATYEEAVLTLARWQGESAEPDLQIYSFPDPERKVVRLVHVSEGIADRGGIRIFNMGSSEEFPFKSSVALTAPKYWNQLLNGEQMLPAEWVVSHHKKVWPDDGA